MVRFGTQRALALVILITAGLWTLVVPAHSAQFAGQKTVDSLSLEEYDYWTGIGSGIKSYNPSYIGPSNSDSFSTAWIMADYPVAEMQCYQPSRRPGDPPYKTWAQAGTMAGADGDSLTPSWHISPMRFWEYCQMNGAAYSWSRNVYTTVMSGTQYEYDVVKHLPGPDGTYWWGVWLGDCCSTPAVNRVVLGQLPRSTARMSASGEVHYNTPYTYRPQMNSRIGGDLWSESIRLNGPFGWARWGSTLAGGRKTAEVETLPSVYKRNVTTANSDIVVVGGGD